MDDHDDRRTKAQTNAVDLHVGARIRIRRKALGISQSQLGEQLRLTFQQVQKYERGSNRVSASKLYETARVLGVRPDFFFEGLPEPVGGAPGDAMDADVRIMQQFLLTAEGPSLAVAVSQLSEANRNRVMNLLWALTSDEAAL